ncbi:MAG: AAA domain-containing protein [Pseudomonadales bacterium]|nr:AAA domain-containing protein [Pseudomonadales bacterium]
MIANESHQFSVTPALGANPRKPIAQSAAMAKVLGYADKVAKADISVFISGESGTGKEVVARYLHEQSRRSTGPFVAMNCAAIPETMLEATLFGHEKGAFTGATEKRVGKFEMADGGTLLLDEITEMPIGLQAKLLRVLQEREIERLGSAKALSVDVRILATTNRDLVEAVRDGHLREDLYYRLSVFPLELPSLSERVEDILPLAESCLSKFGQPNMELSEGARARLLSYSWPGNVRELENCMQRALVLCEGTLISEDLLDIRQIILNEPDAATNGLHAKLKSNEDALLLDALSRNKGVRKHTAIELGISERTLRHKIKQMRDKGLLLEGRV